MGHKGNFAFATFLTVVFAVQEIGSAPTQSATDSLFAEESPALSYHGLDGDYHDESPYLSLTSSPYDTRDKRSHDDDIYDHEDRGYSRRSYGRRNGRDYDDEYHSYEDDHKEYHEDDDDTDRGYSHEYSHEYPNNRGYGKRRYEHKEKYTPKPERPYHKKPKIPDFAAECDFGIGAGPSAKIAGRLLLTQNKGGPLRINGKITNLSPGQHGIHVHQWGDFSNKCESAGVHFNPFNQKHGGLRNSTQNRHAGDLGNAVADKKGIAPLDIFIRYLSIEDYVKNDINGRSIVVHAKPDDLGKGKNYESKVNGNSGARLRCCQIHRIDPATIAPPPPPAVTHPKPETRPYKPEQTRVYENKPKPTVRKPLVSDWYDDEEEEEPEE